MNPRRCRIRYDARLVEEAAIRAAMSRSAAARRRFHEQRDAVYEIRDPAERERQFHEVHQHWFERLDLAQPITQALNESSDPVREVAECRVGLAVTRKDELADLFDTNAAVSHQGGDPLTRPSAAQPKIIFIRLRPESFLDPEALLAFLRHELLHVADMVDPRFGYMKDLLASDTGPSYDAILRTRYRVVWDATIDGRLARKGWAKPGCREVRLKEFSQTFSMLNTAVTEAFSRWFDGDAHTHAAIMAFAQDPRGLGSQVGRLAGRCPICRFPTVRLDPDPARLSAAGRRELHADHPGWRLDEGLCSQCLDLYEASASGRRERCV